VEARPRIIEVLLVYSLVLVIIVLLSYALIHSVALFITIIATAVFAIDSARATFRYATERYFITSEYIGIERGWFDKETALLPAANVAEVKAVRPLLLRLLSIGSVYVATNDGSTHVLYHVKHPESIVGAIRPAATGQAGGG
jgi:membrane protein YdbS with pleckstrin-like domain